MVQLSSRVMSQPKSWPCLLIFGAVSLLAACPTANAQNLDQGKSGARLFKDNCTTCHGTARGLVKDRYTVTLFMFLKDHYATNSSSAWELASYLKAVDSPQRGRSRAAAANPSPTSPGMSGSVIRPPLPVPSR